MINLKTKNSSENILNLNNIETILFDKDGTFIDLHYFWGKMTELRVAEVLEIFNLKKNLFNKLCFYLGYDTSSGKMLSDGITALYSRPKIIEIFKNDLKNHNINTTNQQLENIFDSVNKRFYENMQEYTKPIDSAIVFIKKIRKVGIKTGIVTSDSKESTLLTLKHFRWESLFDVVIGRESSPMSKESGVPTKMALEMLKANPLKTLMIGDAPMDYISAQNAGIKYTILVATGQVNSETLKKQTVSLYNEESPRPFILENLANIEIEDCKLIS